MTYGMYSHDIIEDFFWIALNERGIQKLTARLNITVIQLYLFIVINMHVFYTAVYFNSMC